MRNETIGIPMPATAVINIAVLRPVIIVMLKVCPASRMSVVMAKSQATKHAMKVPQAQPMDA